MGNPATRGVADIRLLAIGAFALSFATTGTASPDQQATAPSAATVPVAWKSNGCTHGHRSFSARRGLRIALRAAHYSHARARHYVRCVTSTRLERNQVRRFRRLRAWRRSYRGFWYVQAKRHPGSHARLARLRFCESTNDYAEPGEPAGAYQYFDSTWARAQAWVPYRYRTGTASAASVNHQDVVTDLFYWSHSGEWSCHA